ncbi:subtilisin-like protease SBT5.4 [Impatiens glandulifera]|uniref:subtilisin-like protease SBT5.4 n=1 Tax=Impatiens glandulifera TaxID=253017 RepID=UPI001FB11EC0|nr:subtilisin-like protease SBT5.4 [Impatiens glandulifera]
MSPLGFEPYVIYMGAHSHGEYGPMDADIDRVKNSHQQFLSSFLPSEEKHENSVINSYTKSINGFSAMLDENQAAEMEKNPNVVSVFPNKGRDLHTTRSWDFLSLEVKDKIKLDTFRPNSLWRKANYGEDVIIANLDTGVWPESRSFSDDGYGPIPARWKGFCQNNTKDGVPCNKKLIGARYFNKAYRAIAGDKLPNSQNTARDFEGHGSHTLSTAGGNFVHNASIGGIGIGIAKGGSPRARVAAYKVCWPKQTPESGSCFDGDILKAMDSAIDDGVDVLSLSVGGFVNSYMTDAISIGGFHAVKKGVVMVLSAGNNGGEWTVANVAPWLLTVAASTIDRQFESLIKLGNGQNFSGASLTKGLPKEDMYPIISAEDAAIVGVPPSDASMCTNGTLDAKKVNGKLLVCLRGENSRLEKGFIAAQAGAVGMILCDKDESDTPVLDLHFLPTSHVNYKTGQAILQYIKSTKNATGHLSASVEKFDVKPSPSMASFSSRGPNKLTPGILKPDITAPGVNIIAAYTGSKSPTEKDVDKRRFEYVTESGTSMSCPHVAGVAGLLKKLHPDWSPAAIKSAIMTTAKTKDNTEKAMLDSNLKKATPFNYGAGHIRPNRANDPGLVYDLSTVDHLNFLCAHGYTEAIVRQFSGVPDHKCSKTATILNYNYPSITVPDISKPVEVTRTLKNVGTPGTYVCHIRAPQGILVKVNPLTLSFLKIGEEKTFTIKMEIRAGVNITMDYVFGDIVWTDDHSHKVKSPIVVGFGMPAPSPSSSEDTAAVDLRGGI